MSNSEQATTTVETAYWCYRCVRFVSVTPTASEGDPVLTCPHCESGFIEEIEATRNHDNEVHNRRFPSLFAHGGGDGASTVVATDEPTNRTGIRFRRRRPGVNRPGTNRSVTMSFNPVIVLRGPTALSTSAASEDVDEDRGNRYEFFYDDGSGSGLRLVPAGVSDFLMGWGFDRLLEQLSHVEGLAGGRRAHPLAAAKTAVEAIPTVGITEGHLRDEEHCAVCKEAFLAGGEAREMPCRHLYHSDCILPWLAIRNSCPVCRFEIEAEAPVEEREEEGEIVGLTIWRLPGGGFAVGRFSGGRSSGTLPFPEMVGQSGSPATNTPRRITWSSRRRRTGHDEDGAVNTNSGEGRADSGNFGIRGVFRGIASLLNWRRTGRRSTVEETALSSVDLSGDDQAGSNEIHERRRRRRSRLDMEVQ